MRGQAGGAHSEIEDGRRGWDGGARSEGEVSRHLHRLHQAGLVEKLASGTFQPTPLALVALGFETGLDRRDGWESGGEETTPELERASSRDLRRSAN